MQRLPLTKIICTIGPSLQESNIRELIKNGITIFRLNFSHGSCFEHKKQIKLLKKLSNELQTIVTICLDTKGHEFRIEIYSSSEIAVKKDQILFFTNKRKKDEIFVPVEDFSALKKGDIFYLDDGFLEIEIIEVNSDLIKGKALNDHRLENNKKANFPGRNPKMISIDKDDNEDIKFGLENDIDIVFASFITSKDDVLNLKKIVEHTDVQLFSKIETLSAVNDIENVIQASDGIMIARGDLGVETKFSELFKLQKIISKLANEQSKPYICATQMIESMIDSTIPLRAEVTDIGNAVLDNFDALMLSGESAIGKNPVLTALSMKKIILNAESYAEEEMNYKHLQCKCPFVGNFSDKTCILVEINSIKGLKFLYNKKFQVQLFIYSDNKKILSIANMYKGMHPLYDINKFKEIKETYNFLNAYNMVLDENEEQIKELTHI